MCVNPNLPCSGDKDVAVRGCLQKVCGEEEECIDLTPQSSCEKYKLNGLYLALIQTQNIFVELAISIICRWMQDAGREPRMYEDL